MVKNHSVVKSIPFLPQKQSKDAIQVRKYLKETRSRHCYFQLLVVLFGVVFLFVAGSK